MVVCMCVVQCVCVCVCGCGCGCGCGYTCTCTYKIHSCDIVNVDRENQRRSPNLAVKEKLMRKDPFL